MSPSQTRGRNRQALLTTAADSVAKLALEEGETDASNSKLKNKSQLQRVLDDLTEVEKALQSVVQNHRHAEYGFITKEWGFTAPGGLGGQLKGKFYPWEYKLRRCKQFFWPIECYDAMEEGPDYGKADPDIIKDLPPEGEQLYKNTPLHKFLKEPPVPAVDLVEADYKDYRSAARIFLLLGTLSHLYGNSAPRGPKTAALPAWIEDPLVEVAKRLKIEPTLSGHFLVQENWIWKSDSPEESEGSEEFGIGRRRFQKRSSITLSKRRLSQNTSRKVEQKIVASLLKECKCEDRMNGLKIYSNCFLGSQCVDIVVKHRYTGSRDEAVKVLRKINRKFNLFYHVTNKNYDLMDKKYLYRFQKEWKKRRMLAAKGDLEDSSIEIGMDDDDDENANRSVSFGPAPDQIDNSNGTSFGADSSIMNSGMLSPSQRMQQDESSISSKNLARLSSSYDNSNIVPNIQKSMHDTMSVIYTMNKVKVKDRRYRLRIYKKCFVGKELIDVLFEHECGPTRKDCLEIARSINQRFKIFEHVKKHHKLKDKHLFYRFTEAFRNMVDSQSHTSTLVDPGRISMGGRRPSVQRRVSFSQIMPALSEIPDLEDESIVSSPVPSRSVSRHNSMESIMSSSQPGRSMSRHNSMDAYVDENLRPSFSYSDYGDQYDAVLGIEEETEFRLDNITMLYPAFGNNHERVNQLVPACMGFALSSLPFDVLDILGAMRDVVEAELNFADEGDNYEISRLYDLVYKVAFSVSKCKEDFQQMSTDPKRRSYNSKYVSIKQTQPLSNGVLVRRNKGEEPEKLKGTTGTQFPYFHILDWLLGRYQFNNDGGSTDQGFVAAVGSVDETFPLPQREYIHCLTKLNGSTCLRGFLEVIGRPKELLTAYNHLLECYAGEGGMLQAHCRKLYSYIHNNVQSSTSGTTHLAANEEGAEGNQLKQSGGCPMSMSSDDSLNSEIDDSEESLDSDSDDSSRPKCPMHSSSNGFNGKQSKPSGCPMSMSASANDSANAIDNHKFAIEMFKHMRKAADDRWKLRLPPLMNEVGKTIYSTSESGGFTTVALDLSGSGLLYEYGDIVKVILPNGEKQTLSWLHSLKSLNKEFFKMEDMAKLQKNKGNGWGWDGLWEALGWDRFEANGGEGVPLEMVARYIEQGNIRDVASNRPIWVHSPLDLTNKGASQIFASPPPIQMERIVSLEPVSPRIYSVSGVEIDRVFLLVSKPDDHARHHGYSSMSDPDITKVHCSFSPATFFLVPPKDANLVCIASGTGISPFVGLVDSIGSRTGSYTIVHQCKSSDMFMCNSQTWLDFTAMNPGAVVMGYISGDRSRRNCPMRYIIRNGAFEETTVLRRNRISAYYFECDMFQNRIFETYSNDALNLAYCCGGVKSAIMPMQNFATENGMVFEFTNESYGVPVTLTKASNLLCQIGGTIIDLNHVSPVHPGGDQILQQAQDIVSSIEEMENKKKSDTPDHSIAFYELHPHAYNLHRCLRTPVDADSKAFAKFLERQAMSKSVLGNMATKYAQAVLSAPESSKIVKIATELQSQAMSSQIDSGDTEGAKVTASHLKQLLDLVPDDDDDTGRWERSLDLLPRRKSSIHFKNIARNNDDQGVRFGSSEEILPPTQRKQRVSFENINIDDDDDDDDHGESWGQTHDFVPRSRRKSSIVVKITDDVM